MNARTLHAGLLRVRRAVARAARFTAKFLVGDAGGLGDGCLWSEGDDGAIYYTSGDVGIGTTSPAQPLDVAGNARISGDLYIGTNGRYFFDDGGEIRTHSNFEVDGEVYLGGYDPSNSIRIGNGAASSPVWAQAFLGSGGYLQIGDTGSAWSGIQFASGGATEAMTILANGNVGIGTTSPAHTLDVVGDGNFSTGLSVDGEACVVVTRTIATTAPLTGGGALSADLTLAVSDFTGDSGSGGASGAVPAPTAGDAAAGKFLSADGGWAAPAGGMPFTPLKAPALISSVSGGNLGSSGYTFGYKQYCFLTSDRGDGSGGVGSFSIFDASQSPPSLVGQIANNSALYFAEGVWVLNDKYAVVAVVGREASYITAWDGA